MQLGQKSLLKSNLDLWLNDLFLRHGLYTNVASGEIDSYGADLSVLSGVNDPSFPLDNTIYQSKFKNWVHEEGIVLEESGVIPTVASGVYVDGIFYSEATTSGTYEHTIDYPNGRIIFSNPLTGSETVQAVFSYKTVMVESADVLNNENSPVFIEYEQTNPEQAGLTTYPEATYVILPAVFIEIVSRESTGYELGQRNPIADYFGVLHIWSRYEYQRDIIEDILTDEYRQVLKGINFNSAPYPLLHDGSKNPAFSSYSTYADVHSSYFWRRIYLDDINARKDSPLYEVERTQVNFNARIYPNF